MIGRSSTWTAAAASTAAVFSVGSARILISKGDITKWRGDAIVNAANERMLGGGGVDGAIHRAAGPDLLRACRAVTEVSPNIRCPTGQARITPGFYLPAKYVIHTVGPVYSRKKIDVVSKQLESAYTSSCMLAIENKLESIAFPAISCGVYGYPLSEAADIALASLQSVALSEENTLKHLEFVLFSEDVRGAWLDAAARLQWKRLDSSKITAGSLAPLPSQGLSKAYTVSLPTPSRPSQGSAERIYTSSPRTRKPESCEEDAIDKRQKTEQQKTEVVIIDDD